MIRPGIWFESAAAGLVRSAAAVARLRLWQQSLVLLWFSGAAATGPCWADGPAVRFDMAATVPCREVTADDFPGVHAEQRLVQATIRVSALAADPAGLDRLQYVYQFIGPTGALHIVDYDPKTELVTDYAGQISIERKKEATRSLGVNVSGTFSEFLHGSGGGDLGDKTTTSVRYEMKAPQFAVLAAGTIHRGTGVSFRLRPSAETSLEGARDFTLVFRVPRAWRGDVLYVRCTAFPEGKRGGAASTTQRFLLGLYQAADEEALLAAEQLARAEGALRRSVARHEKQIERSAFPTVVHRFGAKLDLVPSKLPPLWLERVIFGSSDLDRLDFLARLPGEVREMARYYAVAKQRLMALSGHRFALALTAP